MATQAETEIRARLSSLIILVKQFHYLTESRMTDFFTKDHFSKLPLHWRNFFRNINLEDVGQFLDFQQPAPCKHVWPLSLLSLRKIIETNCLPRQQQSKPLKTNGFSIHTETPTKTDCLDCDRLQFTFSKHVKPKKKYEIQRMGLETARLSAETNAKIVIDIGSGLGHLCRILAYGYGLNVVGVETQIELKNRAEVWDRELEISAGKVLCKDFGAFRPRHLVENISFDTSPEDFHQLVETACGDLNDYGIVGLHPCGNLAPMLLKLFSNSPHAKFLVLASCCYHRMFSDNGKPCFPMSNFLQESGKIFNFEGAAWACHAIEVTSKRLSTSDYDFLKIHCFRATLEQIISNEWPEHLSKCMNNVPHYPDLTFEKYCEKALKKLGLTVTEQMLQNQDVQKNLSRWKEVVLFHALCVLLAPVSETIFQLDRMLYLTEQGIPCQLQAVFDPQVSPRNYILTAMKPASKK